VSYTSKELAGVAIASRCTAVILGTRTPWVVDRSSRMAEASGVLVPMPTLFWAGDKKGKERKNVPANNDLKKVVLIFMIKIFVQQM
jgi:hypothetical protein